MTVGVGDRPVGWVAELLASRDRTQAGVTAPPQGLYFARVEYDARWGLPAAGLR
jgi:tRNA pseudouridine38-40 synthase